MSNATESQVVLPTSILVKHQGKNRTKFYTENGHQYRITAHIRYDDECGNGYNTFSITGTIDEKSGNGQWRDYSGGCIHEEIVKHFPDLAPFIKWHLTGSDGPMHYIANVIYHAGNRDCWGCKAGEVRSWTKAVRHGKFPILFEYGSGFIKWLESVHKETIIDSEVLPVEHAPDPNGYKFGPKYTLGGFSAKWHECPFDTAEEALAFIEAVEEFGLSIVKTPSAYGEGKARDFAAARNGAVWPEATDEQLSVEPEELKKALLARLPKLMEEFKRDMESLGFVY